MTPVVILRHAPGCAPGSPLYEDAGEKIGRYALLDWNGKGHSNETICMSRMVGSWGQWLSGTGPHLDRLIYEQDARRGMQNIGYFVVIHHVIPVKGLGCRSFRGHGQ